MSSPNHNKLRDILVHSCNKVLRALLPVIISRYRPSGSGTLDQLLLEDRQKLENKTIVKQNYHLIFLTSKLSIDNWDLQLLCFFIKYCCPRNDPICADIDTLKDIRNKLCHTANGLIDDAYYQHKRDEIRNINTRFLNIISDDDLAATIYRESDEIDQGARNVPEAIDTLRIWLQRDKKLRKPIENFSGEHQFIITQLSTMLQQSGKIKIPDAEIDIIVKNADNIQQADQVSDTLVNIIDPHLRADPILCKLTDDQFSVINGEVHEAMTSLLESGQVVVGASHGCCIVTVRSTSFNSLLQLWKRIVRGEADIVFEPLKDALRSFGSNELNLKVVLPECGFLQVVNNLVTQLQDIQGELPILKEFDRDEHIHGLVQELEQFGVREHESTTVIKLRIIPSSFKDLETIHEHFSDDSVEKSFKRLTRILQDELSAPKLNLTVRLHSPGPSAKPKIIKGMSERDGQCISKLDFKRVPSQEIYFDALMGRKTFKEQNKEGAGPAKSMETDLYYEDGERDTDVIVQIDENKDLLEQAGRNICDADANVLAKAGIAKKHGNFWETFIERVKSADMFMSSDKGGNYLPADNKEAQKKELYVAVGKVIGLLPPTIVQQHLPLAAYVVRYIRGDSYKHWLDVGFVHDAGLVGFLQEMNTCSHQDSLNEIIARDEKRLKKHLDNQSHQITMSNVEEVSRNMLTNYLIDSRKDSLEQMRQGYSQSRDYEYLRISDNVNSASGCLLEVLKQVQDLPTSDDIEESVKQWMGRYLQELINAGRSVALIRYITGLGLWFYGDEPRICLCLNKLDEQETKPLAVPCVHVLKLPLGNKTYQQFQESFESVLKLFKL